MSSQASNSTSNAQPKAATSWCEGLFAALGLLLVLGTVGYLVYRAVTTHVGPPEIRIEQRAITPLKNGFVVEVDVRNDGNRTAAALTVEGELDLPGSEKETSDVSLDYVPGHSHRRAGLFFEHDPERYPLKLRAKGYQEP